MTSYSGGNASMIRNSSSVGGVLVGGRMMSGKQLKEYTTKNGLCPICAETKVKEKRRRGLGHCFEPLTIEDDKHDGQFLVYKGYCLGALCYSLEQAMKELGEIDKKASKSEIAKQFRRRKQELLGNFRRTERNNEEILDAEVTYADPGLAAAAAAAAAAPTDATTYSSHTDDSQRSRDKREAHAPNQQNSTRFRNGARNRNDSNDEITFHRNYQHSGMSPIKSGEMHVGDSAVALHHVTDHSSIGSSSFGSHERSREPPHSKSYHSGSDAGRLPPFGNDSGSHDNRSRRSGPRSFYDGSDVSSDNYSNKQRTPTRKKSTLDLVFVPPKAPPASPGGSNLTPHLQRNSTMDAFLDTPPIPEYVDHHEQQQQQPQQNQYVPRNTSQRSGLDARRRPVREESTPGMTSTTSSSASDDDILTSYYNRNKSCEVEYEVSQRNLNYNQSDTSKTTIQTDDPIRSSSITTEMINEESRAIFEVEEFARKGDYHTLITECLYTHVTNPSVVHRSFQLLRNGVHRLGGYVFESSSWVKVCLSAMENNCNNYKIQTEAVLMFWSIASVDTKYMKDVSKNSCISAILYLMYRLMSETDNGFTDDVDEENTLVHYACGFLECLTSKEEYGLNVRHASINVVITALLNVLNNNDIALWNDKTTINDMDAKVLSIRALYNLSYKDGLGQKICNCMAESEGFNSIVFVIKNEKIYPDTAEWAIRLLWRLCSAADISLPDDATTTIVSGDLIGALLITMNTFYDVSLHAAACGLLLNLARDQLTTSCAPTTSIADAVLLSARNHSDVPEIQLQCVNVLNALCSDEEQCKVVAEMDIVGVLVDAMNNFEDHAKLQGAASMTLAYIASNDEQSQKSIISNLGVHALVNAFHTFGIDDESSSDFAGMVVDGACSALAALSTSSQAAKEIKESGMLFELEKYLDKHTDKKMTSYMITLVINVLTLSGRLGFQGDRNDDRAINLLLKTLESLAIVEEAEILMSSLLSLSAGSPLVLDSLLTYDEGRGISHILRILESFVNSIPVQKGGCAILGNIYIKIPYNGTLNQISEVKKGSSSVKITSHTIREAKALLSAMEHHKNNESIQMYACDALSNFIAGSSDLTFSYEVDEPDEVIGVFAGCFKKVIDLMSIYEESLDMQRSVTRLLLVLLFLHDEMELKRWSSHLSRKILEAMGRFQEDDVLYTHACGILTSLVEEEDTAQEIVENDGIKILVNCLRFKNEEIVEQSSRTLATLLRNVYTANNDFMEIDDSIPTVMLCMMDNSNYPEIQINTCSVLKTVACLHENYVKALIANNGGVNACMGAIRRHGSNEAVVEVACRALSDIIDGVNPKIIVSVRGEICGLLVDILRDHKSNPEVMEALFAIMWGLCTKDAEFKGSIADAGCIPSIVEIMSKHLRHEPCQRRGCALFWMLSSHGENKQLIGSDGACAIINAMMYHISSMALQKEGLVALKNLATVGDLKVAIRSLGGVDAIVSAMWMNMSSDIICAAVSALNNIAVDREKKTVARMGNGELDVICFGMRKFQNESEVQKCACFLLKTYVFERSNRTLLQQRDEVVALLTAAADRYPSECGDRASHVLSALYS